MKLANSIEIDGIFWLAEAELDENKSVGGHLTINTDGSSQLRLYNAEKVNIHEILSQCIPGATHPSIWITGRGRNEELIWLYVHAIDIPLAVRTGRCLTVRTVFIHNSLQSLRNVCIRRPDQIAFNGLTCEIEGVWEWLGVSGFHYSVDVGQWYRGDRKEPLDIRYECPSVDFLESRKPLKWRKNKPKVSITFRIAPASYSVPHGSKFIYPKFTLKEATTIEIRPESGSLEVSDVVEQLLLLRNFFAVSMDMPVNIVQCDVYAANDYWGEVNGTPIANLSMYRNIGYLHGKPFRPGKEYVRIDRTDRVGERGHLWPRLTAWYEHYDERGYAIEEYLDGHFQDGPVSATRVMALWRAIEALVEASRERIAIKLHSILEPVIEDNNERKFWVQKLARIRGNLAHGDNKRRPSLNDLEMAYSLFITAFNFHILKEIGIGTGNLLDKDNQKGLLHHLDTGSMSMGYLHRYYIDVIRICKQCPNTINSPLTIDQIRENLRLKEEQELNVALEIAGWHQKEADTWVHPFTSQ